MTVNDGSTISVTGNSAISLGNNATITVRSGAAVTNNVTSGAGDYSTGNNTIQFNSNGTLTVEQGGSVIKTGTQGDAEAVNVHGFGNTVLNRGLIQTSNSATIWFQDQAAGAKNVVDNYGTIERVGGGSVIGASGNNGINFYNRTGAIVRGNLSFAGGNDDLYFFAGSLVAGSINGGGGTNNLTLEGAAGSEDSFGGSLTNFTTLTKDGAGRWTVFGSINGNTVTTIRNGTLALTGDNAGYTGRVVVEAAGVLEARAQSLPTRPVLANNTNNVENNGLLRFVQSDDGTYIGQIVGTGAIEKTGAGVVTLAPVAAGGNSYSGGTFINQGTLAAGADNVLGAATGGLTFNGGTLRFNSSFNLSGIRAITLNVPGGTVDTQAFDTTVSQGIVGAGSLTKAGSGTLALTGANAYTGGTTIAAGTLQLGNGGTSGSIVGNVANNGVLAFNRSDASVFSGLISGSGAVQQIGTGTTVLTADNTYTGGTSISIGTLQLGNGGTSGSVVGDVTNDGAFAFNRSDTFTFDGVVSGTGRLSQIGTGTTILTADSTYSGGTSVTAGTLAVGNAPGSSAALSGGGAIAVASGATLGGYGSVTGDVTNAGRIAVADAVAAFTGGPGGNFTVNGDLVNSGLVQIGGAGVGNTLTVTGTYNGQNGIVALNTVLGGDGSASDRLVINGGTAVGRSGLQITSAGGGGALTTGNGILVVDAVNGGTTSVGSFGLTGPVVAGAYEYHLFRGSVDTSASDSWYLRSEAVAVPTPPTPPTPTPPTPPSPQPPTVIAYRAEVPLLSALPNLAREMGLATLGTWHERVGGDDIARLGLVQPTLRSGGSTALNAPAGLNEDRASWASGAWGRVFGQKQWTTQHGTVRPETDAAIGGFQIGLDLWQRDWADGARTKVGVFGAYTYGEGDVSGFASGVFNRAVGTLTTDATTLGAYATHIAATGWYVDGVVQHTWLDSDARVLGGLSNPSTDGRLWTASLEAGAPFRLNEHWAIEPQAQLIYQHLDWDDASITNAGVRFDADDAWTGRLGARLQGSWQAEGGTIWQPYLLANLWHRFGGTDNTSFVTSAVTTVIPTEFGGTSLELGGGAKVQVNQSVELYGQASYALPVGSSDDDRRALKGNLGLTVRW
ncbi:autotransporter outer membrane beta-barrel domain-containing protein [Microvirga sp. BSC39]|uniref:autotransporter outer membrane beta-barrel domain-containing protein n=1 Tax=Microvirga sp. BSC39 TaxID=1549810 RepID=UPI0006925B15|nr:autotransporter outer membrane beta-barrel domain-containing protein [Microvirga sp. BSC39]